LQAFCFSVIIHNAEAFQLQLLSAMRRANTHLKGVAQLFSRQARGQAQSAQSLFEGTGCGLQERRISWINHHAFQ
jgi:hypothetical protein